MFNNKKAQDLSITTIIIAAIAVVVLVVIIAIFTGRLGMFTGALGQTSAEKTKDSALNQCIPTDNFYQSIETAQIAYNKDPTQTTLQTLTNAKTNKNNELQVCKLNEKAQCKTNCQWVGN